MRDGPSPAARAPRAGPFLLGPHSLQMDVLLSEWPSAQGGPAPAANAGAHARRQQSAAARSCAAQLLAALGAPSVEVGRQADGAPRWPDGYVGSLSHTAVRAAAAVARADAVRSIGIDLELLAGLEVVRDIEAVCLHPSEIALRTDPPLSGAARATLCFSAKEALYKCLYPLVNQYFDFMDARVERIAPDGALQVRLLRRLGPAFAAGTSFEGRYRFDEQHVFTSFELAA